MGVRRCSLSIQCPPPHPLISLSSLVPPPLISRRPLSLSSHGVPILFLTLQYSPTHIHPYAFRVSTFRPCLLGIVVRIQRGRPLTSRVCNRRMYQCGSGRETYKGAFCPTGFLAALCARSPLCIYFALPPQMCVRVT